MRWRKLGRITTDRASYPTVDRVDGRLRLYFARRDDLGPSRVHFLAVDPDDPTRPGAVTDRPLFELGRPARSTPTATRPVGGRGGRRLEADVPDRLEPVARGPLSPGDRLRPVGRRPDLVASWPGR